MKNKSVINKIRQQHLDSLTLLDKVGLAISKWASTVYFFIFCCVIVCIPFILPSTLSVVQFISSGIIQLIMLPVLAFAAAMSSRFDDVRAEHDLKVNELAEKEIREMREIIDEMHSLILAMQSKSSTEVCASCGTTTDA